jgi:CubicO group peptidase (beta-lactamase class C family)
MRDGQTGRAAIVLIVLAQVLMSRSGGVITHAQEGREAMLARAAEAELDTEYAPPPGDPLWHHTAGFAKTLCSAVFVTGLDPEFAAENVGFFSSPYEHRHHVTNVDVDRDLRQVHLTLPDGVVRTAKFNGDHGCVTLPIGEDDVYFEPVDITTTLPDPATQAWPMGDVLPSTPLPAAIDADKVAAAVEAAFDPAGMTGGLVITHKGRIIGERYGDGITMHTPLESWSMGKSLTATLMGVLIEQGVYDLYQPAPVPEWQTPEDPRQAIRIADILHMSSGLRFRGVADPDLDPALGYPDHLYVYTGTVDSFEWAATRPQQWPPNTIGRYRNSDPVLINYLVRLGVEGRGDEYLSFPQRELFDKIGARGFVLETDPYGNYLLQGYELAPARDWARLGNLYLQNGVWNGERILPEGYTEFVSTLAPAWEADGRPIYGGFFWINGTGSFPVPREAYYMSGAGGQTTLIIPSHDLVVVRQGHYGGARAGGRALRDALALLMEAVPPSD